MYIMNRINRIAGDRAFLEKTIAIAIPIEVAVYVNLCFLVFIMYLPFKMFNTINIVGILRSGTYL